MLTWFKNQVRGDAADFEDTASLSVYSWLFLKSSCSLTYKCSFSALKQHTTPFSILTMAGLSKAFRSLEKMDRFNKAHYITC